MAKVNLISLEIRTKKVIKDFNVSTLTVSNLSSVATTFLFNGVTRKLPPVDADGLPVQPFVISDNGHFFDIELNFNQASNNLLVDYTTLQPQKKEC